jgi:hypothetical protein
MAGACSKREGKVLSENSNVRDYLEDINIDGKVML